MARAVSSPKGVARREQILATAMERLANGGYGQSSLRGIARALELEPAHILYYFDSREELLQTVIERWDDEALASMGGRVDPAEALDFYVRAIRHNLQLPGIVHLYLTMAAEAVQVDHPSHEFFRARFGSVRTLLSDAIRAEQRSGRIRATLDPDVEARRLIALADGLQLQALVDPAVDAPGELETAIDALRS